MLLKLTAIPHPDINAGQPYPVYVDPSQVVLIEKTKTRQQRFDWEDAQSDAARSFWDEVQRCTGEVSASMPTNFMPDDGQEAQKFGDEMKRWATRRDIAASIHAAYGIINSLAQQPARYPSLECTVIQLAVPNARFTMLPAIYVQETPEQVARLIDPGTWRP